jgi:hypothetical protein
MPSKMPDVAQKIPCNCAANSLHLRAGNSQNTSTFTKDYLPHPRQKHPTLMQNREFDPKQGRARALIEAQ